ncbi:hypothetical protein [Cupriavidus sp. TMH.W2]|uniref:hypothetical protein n=1 Tax=Cupriavidus sp. TMH.W2 TaxID=3434465 RepID=UPI003D77D5F5
MQTSPHLTTSDPREAGALQPATRERAATLGRAIAAERGVDNAVAAIERFCGRQGA